MLEGPRWLFLGFSVCVILEMSAMLGGQARVGTAAWDIKYTIGRTGHAYSFRTRVRKSVGGLGLHVGGRVVELTLAGDEYSQSGNRGLGTSSSFESYGIS